MSNESLKNKTIRSVGWSIIERFSAQGIQFLLTIIIARLVSPTDYGLIAMLGIFLSIAQTFVDSGFSNALVQKQHRTEHDFSTVFYFNIGIGFLTYMLLFGLSPLIAIFYEEPQLEPLTRIIGINIIVTSFSVVHRAKLTINLNFKILSIASLIGVIISGFIGIYFAYYGYGVWAIAIQSLLNNFLQVVALWCLVKWKPLMIFSLESFKSLWRFGSKLLTSGLIHTLYTNSYNIVIGKVFSSTELGYFNRAYTFAYFPSTNFSYVITRGIYPIFCSLQDEEDKLKSYFLKSMRMSSFIIIPIMVILVVLAKPIVLLLLTEKWIGMVPLLRVLCLAYLWTPIMDINNNLINAKGFSNYFLKAEIQKKVFALILLLCTIPFGVFVMCTGLILYSIVDWFIISKYTKKTIGCGFWTQLKYICPILIINLFLGGIVYLASLISTDPLMQIICGVTMGIIVYPILTYLFKMRESDLFSNVFGLLNKCISKYV